MAWHSCCDVTLVWKTQVSYATTTIPTGVVGDLKNIPTSYVTCTLLTDSHRSQFLSQSYSVTMHTVPPPPPTHSRGLIMGIWNSHTSVGNILGTIIPSFWADCDGEPSPWGWSFIVPAAIMLAAGVLMFLMLVVDPRHVGLPPPRHTTVSSIYCLICTVQLFHPFKSWHLCFDWLSTQYAPGLL